MLSYLLVVYPFAEDVRSPWLALAAVPGFLLYAADLPRYGYRRRDLLGVYALNLALIPAYVCGTLRSLEQVMTGRRTVFGRTPKVEHRTALSPSYVIAEWAMLLFVLGGAARHAAAGRWIYASFLLVNAAALGWAVVALVGVRASVEDLSSSAA